MYVAPGSGSALLCVHPCASPPQAQTQMVIEAMKYVDEVADKEERIKLISTLRTITDGKV